MIELQEAREVAIGLGGAITDNGIVNLFEDCPGGSIVGVFGDQVYGWFVVLVGRNVGVV